MPSAKPIAAAAACETVSSTNFFTAIVPPLCLWLQGEGQHEFHEHLLKGWAASQLWHPKILADLSCQMVVYFVVAWNSTALVLRRVMPPRMLATFSEKGTAVR